MRRVIIYVDGFNLYFELMQSKRVIAAFPTARFSHELKRQVNGFLVIGEDKRRASQLPEQITKPDGFMLHRPSSWN